MPVDDRLERGPRRAASIATALASLFGEFGFRSSGKREVCRRCRPSVRREQPTGSRRYQRDRHARGLRRGWSAELRQQKCVLVRYRDDQRLAALGRARRLFVRLEGRRGVVSAGPRAGGRAAARPGRHARSLRPILENPAIEKIGQNLKYDMIVLRAAGVELAGVAFDTMVASYLLDAGERNHNLDELAQRYLRPQDDQDRELIGTGKNQKRMDEVPRRAGGRLRGRGRRCCRCGCGRSWPSGLHETTLDKLFDELELPLIDVLVELEYNGIKVDVEPAGRAEPPVRRADGAAGAGDLRAGRAARSTSPRPSSFSRCCSTS